MLGPTYRHNHVELIAYSKYLPLKFIDLEEYVGK